MGRCGSEMCCPGDHPGAASNLSDLEPAISAILVPHTRVVKGLRMAPHSGSALPPSLYQLLPSSSIPLPSYALPLSHRDKQTTKHLANLINTTPAASLLHAHLHSLEVPPANSSGSRKQPKGGRKRAGPSRERSPEPEAELESEVEDEGRGRDRTKPRKRRRDSGEHKWKRKKLPAIESEGMGDSSSKYSIQPITESPSLLTRSTHPVDRATARSKPLRSRCSPRFATLTPLSLAVPPPFNSRPHLHPLRPVPSHYASPHQRQPLLSACRR